MQIVRIVSSFLVVMILYGAVVAWRNQPQSVGNDVPAGKLMSLSFAPFREGFSPLEEVFPLPQHIDEDLRLLADKTHSIRTYSSLGGMQVTPDLARKHGISMIQGGWLGAGFKDNRLEMEALIQSANAHPDVVKRVMVGNEVLLRGDLPVDRLIAYIREVKKAVKQPVSYADVWSMWMKHPQLFKEVDFITIHILPYWEDEPIAVSHAPEHLEKIVKQVEDEARGVAPGKSILIGESGWPAAGRQRGLAVPSVVNEAQFIRGMIEVANRHHFDYNIVEAFNQPWKSHLEGVVGANWGLFSAARQPVFSLTGPVSENADWWLHVALASSLAGLLALAFRQSLMALSWPRVLLFALATQWLSSSLVDLADSQWYTSYSVWQRTYTVTLVLANAALLLVLLRRAADYLQQQPSTPAVASALRMAYLAFGLLALYKTLALAINGRYLSFPVEQALIPVWGVLLFIGLAALRLAAEPGKCLMNGLTTGWPRRGTLDSAVGCSLLLAGVALVIGETKAFMDGRDFILAHPGVSEGLPVALGYCLHNQQLLAWLGCGLVLALPLLRHTPANKPATAL
jgi:exo-beta-1,3-glucanase (GH17 family)